MIPAVAQTLAEILAGGTSLIRTEQIDFNHPALRRNAEPGINLYCYDLRVSDRVQPSSHRFELKPSLPRRMPIDSALVWLDVSFLVSAWDDTALGEQHLLSEALKLLLPHRLLKEEFLTPALRGYGSLPLSVCAIHPAQTTALWLALGVPLRPALYVTVTIPVKLHGTTVQAEPALQGGVTHPEPLQVSW